MSQNNDQLEPMDWQQQQDEMAALADRVLQRVEDLGASSVRLSISNSQGVSVEVRQQQVDTLEFNRDKGLSLTVYQDQQKGSASTSDFSEKSIEKTLEAALSIARHTEADPFSGLPESTQYASEFPDLELYYPWQTSVNELIELAQQTEKHGLQMDQRICNSEGSTVTTYEGLTLLATSNGFRGFNKGSSHSLSCVLIAEDDDGLQRDYYYSTNRNADQMLSPKEIGEQAASRTVARLNAKSAKQGKFPVIFSAEMSRGLLGHYLSAVSGGQLYRKSSFLLDSLGKKIFPEWFCIEEQPHLKSALGSAVFDGEGVATKNKFLVQDGKVNSYLLSCYSARKLSMETTANAGGTFNLRCSHGDYSQQDLIAEVKEGLLVTEVMGQGINLVTGDYSRGAGGFWIKDGKISHAVKEITIAGNLSEMFAGFEAMANDLDYRSSVVTGSLLVNGLTVAI